ncbi:DUF2637 domain-containing protein [Streptomyces sp. NBRC 109706]|uniref:DUF2637 domain-containing protein n=1 Tax=Streptomyces sp. NBRC 109706 TaxID=1550035 RepID=UPI000784B716|nr:DUF2637 domain-containing protein [Streptomyces sp. NBRC 109706]
MSWAEDRRADRAADAEQKRLDAAAREELARKRREEEDERQRAKKADEKREKKQRRKDRRERWATTRASLLANLDTSLAIVAMTCSIGPAFYFQLKAMIGAGAPLMVALALAIMLESGAQVATITGEKAKRDGRPVGPHRIAMWGCASIAAGINGMKAPAMFPGASWMVIVLALSSYGGVAFWELRSLGRHRGKGARTKQQRAEAKARRKHEKKRRKEKPVWTRYEEILTAHPYGTVDREEAWAEAWQDVTGAPLGQTVAVVAGRLAATRAVEQTVTDAGHTPESLAVEAFLRDVFPASGRGDDGEGGIPLRSPSGGPSGGAPEAAKTLGRKGKQASGRASSKTPQKPIEEADLEKVRKFADALGDTSKLSARNVREVLGGGANEYIIRVRDAVKKEREDQ